MTNEVPFEQPIEPTELEPEASSTSEDAADFIEPDEHEEAFALSMELYEQPELPIVQSLKQKV
ncbi:MAG: hypothetical protein ACK466_06165, partial [Pseudanabaena sp.]